MAHEDIEAYLSAAENEAGITILGAWNTGSRAWGLNDPSSDHDISFVFTQPLKNYATGAGHINSLALSTMNLSAATEDTEIPRYQIEGEGWDSRDFIQKLFANNPSALEALFSPIAYRPHPALQAMREYVGERFNAIEAHNHYQSMSNTIYDEHITSIPTTLKQTLMIARSCMYATYIKETHEFPELRFPTFIEEERSRFEERWDIEAIQALIERKQSGDGDAQIGNPHKEAIEASLNDGITDYEQHVRPKEKRMRKKDLAEMMCDLLDSQTLLQ